MQHITTLVAAFLLSISLQAQPVLLESDLPPASTSMQIYSVVNAGSSNPAIDGANVTWDFTSAQLQLIGTAFMGSPNGTPFATDFPTSNWSITQDLLGLVQRYAYFRSSPTALELLADNVPADDANIYVNARQVLQFPFDFTNSFSDNYQLEGGQPASVTWTYTGYGTVLTDLGIDQNVVKTISNDNEIVFWKKTPLHPFIIINPAGILVFSSNPIGIEEVSNEVRPSLYPNPVQDVLHLANALPGMRYSLHDALGRIVLEGSIQDRSAQAIDIGHLASGNYQMRIHDERRSTVLPLIKQ